MEKQFEENPSHQSKFLNKRIYLIAGILGTLIVITIINFLFVKNFNKTPKSSTIQEGSSPKIAAKQEVIAPPLIAQKYSFPTSLPIAQNVKTYKLKSNFSSEEISSFAKKLGISKVFDQKSDTWHLANLSESKKMGVLLFNSKSGAFTYESFGQFKPANSVSSSLPTTTVNLLKELEMYDSSITCKSTYKRADTPDVSFVECHRDWVLLGGPLVNLGGVLNISSDTKLSALNSGTVIATDPTDSAIIQTNTKQDGKSRPNDFNTITIGYYPNGRVQSINSTIRHIQSTTTKQLDNLSIKKALAQFNENKAEYSLTLPEGNGYFNWSKVYLDNKAISNDATVSEITITYIDKPITSDQSEYQPYIIIRGTAILNSGYRVRFVEGVPVFSQPAVAGETTHIKSRLQLDTFTPTIIENTPIPTSPTLKNSPTPTPIPSQSEVSACQDITGHSLSIQVPGYGNLNLVLRSISRSQDIAHTFFANQIITSDSELIEIRKAFFQAVSQQYVKSVASYITLHPGVITSSMTTDQIKSQFVAITNPLTNGDVCSRISSVSDTILYIPPVTSGSCSQGNRPGEEMEYDYANANNVSTIVAQKIKEALSSGSISSLATLPDLFPPETLDNFHWIFIKSQAHVIERDYGASAACYVSGTSPRIFIYGNRLVSVSPLAKLTFVDPPLNSTATWTVKTSPSGNLTLNGNNYPSLYYEYDVSTVKFSQKDEGLLFSKNNYKTEFMKVASTMALNNVETIALLQDVVHAINSFPDSTNFVASLLDPTEIEYKIPLSLSPFPKSLNRIHFLISPTSKTTINKQVYPKVKRDGLTVVEVGTFPL